jgi:hypothetical protein
MTIYPLVGIRLPASVHTPGRPRSARPRRPPTGWPPQVSLAERILLPGDDS